MLDVEIQLKRIVLKECEVPRGEWWEVLRFLESNRVVLGRVCQWIIYNTFLTTEGQGEVILGPSTLMSNNASVTLWYKNYYRIIFIFYRPTTIIIIFIVYNSIILI